MLLKSEELPGYGTLDYLVEISVGGIDIAFLKNMIADSSLGGFGGRVSVVPAIGAITLKHPQNALGKISRAYLNETLHDGTELNLTKKFGRLVDDLEASDDFDII